MISLCIFRVFTRFYSDIGKDEKNTSFAGIVAGGSEGARNCRLVSGSLSCVRGGQDQARAWGQRMGLSLPPTTQSGAH